MKWEIWLAAFGAFTLLSATPGPNMFYAMTQGANVGLPRAVYASFGLISGLCIMMLGAALGVAFVLQSNKDAASLLPWFGAAYLAWLGVRGWKVKETQLPEGEVASTQSAKRLTIQGFFIALTNPKAMIFFAAIFPQFIDPFRSYWLQIVLLMLTFAAIDFFWQMAYAFGGHNLMSILRRSHAARFWIARVQSLLFLFCAAALAFAQAFRS